MRYRKFVSIGLVVALVVTVCLPRRAVAIVPGIAAAAAAVGVSEGALTATVAGLLTAGGIVFLSDEGRAKSVAVAWDAASEQTKNLCLRSIANSGGGIIQLDIDSACAADVWQMMRAMETDEEIEYQVSTGGTGPGEYIDFNSGPQDLGNIHGVIALVIPGFNLYNYALAYQAVEIKTNVQAQWFDGITVFKEQGDGTVYVTVEARHNNERVYRKSYAYPMPWKGTGSVGDFTIGVGSDGMGNLAYFDNGTMVWSGDEGSHCLVSISSIDETSLGNSYMYDLSEAGVAPLVPGIDYTPSTMTEAQVGSLAGTGVYVDPADYSVSAPAITPPITWPETITGLDGIVGAIQNVWNVIAQGFNHVIALLQTIIGAIGAQLDPGIFDEPVNNLKLFIMSKVPELPDLDTSGFADRQWSWMVTINYPWQLTFEVLNSEMLDKARPTIKGFTSGIMYLLTTLYIYRRVPEIIRG